MAFVADQAYEMPTLPLFADTELDAPQLTLRSSIAPTPTPAPSPSPSPSPAPAPAPAAVELEPQAPEPHVFEPEVEIRVSRRRKKSAVSYWEEGRIVVVLPAHVTGARRDELVAWLVERTKSRRPGSGTTDNELMRRATELADRYVDGVRPSSVRWVTNQNKRWASCTSDTGEIRVSHRLRDVPGWVLDAVLVHELTHLIHPNHSRVFHQVANRHPRQSEASLFLDGFAHGLERR